jgi:cytochrome P450
MAGKGKALDTNACSELAGRLLAAHHGFYDPFPALTALRESRPIIRTGGWYFTTGFDVLVEGYRDKRLSRNRQAVAEMEAHSGTQEPDDDLRQARIANTQMLINLDEPAHRRVRQILEVAFKPTRVAGWQARIDAITDELIGNVTGKVEFDLLRELTYPLPEKVICELTGVPHEDHLLWGKWAEDIVGAARTHGPEDDRIARVEAAQRDFYQYFRDLVAARRRKLGDDLVSILIRAEAEGEKLTEPELYGTLQMLVTAGHETTANLLGNGMVVLMRHPEQYEWLRREPELADSAVEEMLRFDSPSQWSLPREAVEDIELQGVTIELGCPIVMALNAANRDPARFERPDEFDISRSPNRHVAFAAGPHFCLGNQLARMEARTMVHAIATRLPRYELAEEPQLKDSFVRAYRAIPVRVAADQGSR